MSLPLEIAVRLSEHDRPATTEGIRAFLYETGVLLDDMFAEPDTNPAFPESVADALDLASVLIRGGYHHPEIPS